MKKQFASIIEKIQWITAGAKRDGWKGIISEIQLVTVGRTYRDKVKVVDTTFDKYKNYNREGDEDLTLIRMSNDGKKYQIHFGENNPNNWMPKFIQMKLRSKGILPKTHKIKGWEK